MQIRVLFFGILKDLAGRASDSLNLPEGATLDDVLHHYERAIPPKLMASLAISVNQEYSAADVRLNQGDEVAPLPPVSGGSAEIQTKANGMSRGHAAIVKGKIDTASLLKGIKEPEDGAVVMFEGIVATTLEAAALFILTTKPTRRWRSSKWKSWLRVQWWSSRFAISQWSIASGDWKSERPAF